MSILNSVRGRIFIVVCHRFQYLAHCSLIFSLMTFSASWLLGICATTLMILRYILQLIFHEVQEYLKKEFDTFLKYQRTGSRSVTWSLILVNVNSWALEKKKMKMRYLPIMKSDLKKLLLRNYLVLKQTSKFQRTFNKCTQECQRKA